MSHTKTNFDFLLHSGKLEKEAKSQDLEAFLENLDESDDEEDDLEINDDVEANEDDFDPLERYKISHCFLVPS